MALIPEVAKAIEIQTQGGVEVLELVDVPVKLPGHGEVLLKVEWTGVNFKDIYDRDGTYPHPTPWVLGLEPAGKIVAVGSGVEHLKVGDNAVTMGASGGYSQYYLAAADGVAKLPKGITTKQAAASFLQGITALTNVLEAFKVEKGQHVLVHAAAGGVGGLLTQLSSHIGATVIGTTSTEEKADIARRSGAHHVVLYGGGKPAEDVAKEVKALTPGGEGVHAVFDGVGLTTFDSDFDVTRRKGTIVLLGAASGPVPPFNPMKLQPKSLKLTRPGAFAFLATLEEFTFYADRLFELLETDALKILIWKEEGYEFTTEGVRQAHLDLASRATSGKLLIKVA